MGYASHNRGRYRIRRAAHAGRLFLQQQGKFRPFLFDDPTDNRIDDQVLGTGDGSILAFQLVRSMGGFNEPITAPNVVSAIRFNGMRQNQAGYMVDSESGLVI